MGQTGRHLGGRRLDRVPQRTCRDGRSRGQRERPLIEWAAVLGLSLDDEYLGRRRRVVAFRHGNRSERPAFGVVGQAGGRGRLVERDTSPCRARPSRASGRAAPTAAALRAFGGVCQSVSTTAFSAMKTSLLSAHSSTGLFSRSKCRPPERLVLAAVVPAGRRDHGHRGLFRSAVGGAVTDELRQLARQLVGRRRWTRCRLTGCAPAGGTALSIARQISQSRSLRVDVQS